MKATITSLIFLLLSLTVSSQTYKYIGIEEGLSNQKLIANSMMKEDFDRASILENFYPNSIMNLSYYTAFADTKYILFFNFGIILFSVIGFIVIMNMRLDKGV